MQIVITVYNNDNVALPRTLILSLFSRIFKWSIMEPRDSRMFSELPKELAKQDYSTLSTGIFYNLKY